MINENVVSWPSGDCKAVLATQKTPNDFAMQVGAATFRDRDDLDWFEGVILKINPLGTVLVMKHDNNKRKLTAFYVDSNIESRFAEIAIIEFFDLTKDEVEWRVSNCV